MSNYDVIVLGVGGMGSAACYALAKRGVSVLGIEQFSLAHNQGSSHGNSRLIRKAYFEHPSYVPLCTRSYELWDEICEESGRALFHRVGLVMFGPGPDQGVLRGVRESARLYGVPVETFSPEEARSRFPQFNLPGGYYGVLEPDAGYLEVEECVKAMAFVADNRGVDIRTNDVVLDWKAAGEGVEVTTTRGKYSAQRLIVTAGPWTGKVLKDLRLPLVVKRVPQFWFQAPPELSVAKGMPCYAFDLPEGFIYGVPATGGRGLKIATHVPGEVVEDPAQLRREIVPEDMEKIKRVHDECFSGLAKEPEHFAVCMYTLTPDENFIVDVHPKYPQVSFAAGFSGHGFKFAPIMGEVLADLALKGATAEPVNFLKIR